MENFKWRNSGLYQIGHNKQLVILSMVITSSTYCILMRINVTHRTQEEQRVWETAEGLLSHQSPINVVVDAMHT